MPAMVFWLLSFGASVSFALCPGVAFAACAGRPKPRFEMRKAEVLDKQTNLIWRRCSEGLLWSGTKCTGERSLFTYGEAAKAAQAAGSGWRVPNVKELSSLIDASCGRPTVDARAFPDVSADSEGVSAYWTSSASEAPSLFYYVEFMDGFIDAHSAGFGLALRLVRTATGREASQKNAR